MAGIHVKFEVTPNEFLSHLTDAAYKVALQYGFKASFLDVEMDLQTALTKVVTKDMVASPSCGSKECLSLKDKNYIPWSNEAKNLFKEEL